MLTPTAGATMPSSPTVRTVLVAVAVLALPLGHAAAQRPERKFPPDSLTNLKVFPKNTPVRALIDSMRQFTFALGVRCEYCHVGEAGRPLETFDFGSDDKRTKRTARVMLDMIRHINAEHLRDVPERSNPPLRVTCETCHRGRARPERLQDVLARQLADSGLDATVRLYGSLRQRYDGGQAFDFRDVTLNRFASDLTRAGQPDNALAMARLNCEQFPASGQSLVVMSEAYLAKGDTVSAVASLRAAAVKDTTMSAQVRRRLQALGAGGS
ncbi:MAG: c-type cytochrome [Gemmatimonadales bacterium]